MPRDTHYLQKATLTQLIGRCADVEIVETPSGYPREVLEAALNRVLVKLKPFPALAIQPWFWDTPPGLIICLAQWTLYRHEAMNPRQTSLALWGKTSERTFQHLNRLIARGDLSVYFEPQPGVRAQAQNAGRNPRRRQYFRRSEVQALIRSGRHRSPFDRRNHAKEAASA